MIVDFLGDFRVVCKLILSLFVGFCFGKGGVFFFILELILIVLVYVMIDVDVV